MKQFLVTGSRTIYIEALVRAEDEQEAEDLFFEEHYVAPPQVSETETVIESIQEAS